MDAALESSTALVIREAENLEAVETQLLEARFSGSPEDVAASYLYLIPPRSIDRDGRAIAKERQRPGIVGPNADFVNQMVRLLNATQRTKMTIADDVPLFQETTTIDGKPAVRCIVKSIDRTTGDVRWSVKVEAKSPHADTIALVKAQKKALESLPNYDRRAVARRIAQFLRDHAEALRANGIEPQALTISGMGAVSQWSELFTRAREAGVKPEQLRSGIREHTGKGLSEVATTAEVGEAMVAADKVIRQAPLFEEQPAARGPAQPRRASRSAPQAPAAGPSAGPAQSSAPEESLSPEEARERDRVLHGIHDCLAALGTTSAVLDSTLKMQFGKNRLDELRLPDLKEFHRQLQARLKPAGAPS